MNDLVKRALIGLLSLCITPFLVVIVPLLACVLALVYMLVTGRDMFGDLTHGDVSWRPWWMARK